LRFSIFRVFLPLPLWSPTTSVPFARLPATDAHASLYARLLASPRARRSTIVLRACEHRTLGMLYKGMALRLGPEGGEPEHEKGASKTAKPANTTTSNEAPEPAFGGPRQKIPTWE
jgi:hypothetical protein